MPSNEQAAAAHHGLTQIFFFNVQEAVLCLPRFWAPYIVVLTTGPSHMSLSSGMEEDSASDIEIVWAKSLSGVRGLANVFYNEKL